MAKSSQGSESEEILAQSSMGSQEAKGNRHLSKMIPGPQRNFCSATIRGIKSLQITNLRDLQFTEYKEKRWMFWTRSEIKLWL